MRGFDIYIPPDCSCARNADEHRQALAQSQLEAMAKANLRRSTSLKLPNLIRAEQISQRGVGRIRQTVVKYGGSVYGEQKGKITIRHPNSELF